MDNFLIFQIENQHFALPLSSVQRVVRAVEITPLPTSEQCILGLVDVQGTVMTVIDTRKVFRIREKELELSDQFIIASSGLTTLILVADSVKEVAPLAPLDLPPGNRLAEQGDYIDFAARHDDSLVLVINPEKLMRLPQLRDTPVAILESGMSVSKP